MNKLTPIFAFLTLFTAAIARGEASLLKIRQAEKISIALTGSPLTADLRAKIVKEEMTLDALAEQLSTSDGFIEHFAQFWSRLIGMQSPIDMYAQGGLGIGRTWLGVGAGEAPQLNVAYLTKFADDHAKGSIELMITNCEDAPLITWWNSAKHANGTLKNAVEKQIGPGGDPILPDTLPQWQRLYDIARATTATCADTSTIQIKPWWDPEKVTIHSRYINVPSYRTTQSIIDHCGGPTLPDCSLGYDRGGDRFMDEVDYDISMEPGYLISHVVAENKPFTEVLTSQSTIMTGVYGYFMANIRKNYWTKWPGGTITDLSNPIFTSPKVHDRKHYWVNRNSSHAGVLTTPAYQIITNGRRAKANRTYETFLCKKFTVPDGAQADPADANPDLTKRTYCAYCHKSLEPMAAFFNRWPDTGNTIYEFDNNKDPKNDTGRYNGMEGKGAAAFGKILAESDGFDECSIRRAFEFVNGRKMGFIEHDNILPNYLEAFRADQKNLRKVIKAMVLSPDFLQPKGAAK